MEDCTTCTNTTEVVKGIVKCRFDGVIITEKNKIIGRNCIHHSRHRTAEEDAHIGHA